MIADRSYFNSLGSISGPGQVQVNGHASQVKKSENPDGGFEKILQEKMKQDYGIKFSKHAEQRMQMRKIMLSQEQKVKMNEALSRAEKKGIRDSLVLIDNLAFVVNVKNRTVITAVASDELKESAFTNIDGAVFA